MKGKILLSILSGMFLLIGLNSVHAQDNHEYEYREYQGTSTKFAYVASDIGQLNTAMATAEMMRVKKNNYKFKVLVTGILAKQIVEDPKLEKKINECEDMGIDLVVCEYALHREDADISQADERLDLEPNTVIYLFELKDKGYNILQH